MPTLYCLTYVTSRISGHDLGLCELLVHRPRYRTDEQYHNSHHVCVCRGGGRQSGLKTGTLKDFPSFPSLPFPCLPRPPFFFHGDLMAVPTKISTFQQPVGKFQRIFDCLGQTPHYHCSGRKLGLSKNMSLTFRHCH